MAREETRTALLSVSDKSGIVTFAKGLRGLGFKIIASTGTAKVLKKAGVAARDIAAVVGDPILGHRVVTLSREIHAGLLASELAEHLDELKRLDIDFIDLVCVDVYPLQNEIRNPKATRASIIEKIDIGGPTMLSAGAKSGRIVICDPKDRLIVLKWLKAGMPDADAFKQRLSAKADAFVSHYRLLSARYHGKGEFDGVVGRLHRTLRYGENPQQKYAAHFIDMDDADDPLALHKFRQIAGGDPGFINTTDIDRLLTTATRLAVGLQENFLFNSRIAVAVKHGNVCGVGVDISTLRAVQKMVGSDPGALFGGCVLTNFTLGRREAEFLRSGLTEHRRPLDIVVAPRITPAAQRILHRNSDRCRMFINPELANLDEHDLPSMRRFRQVRGGFLVQDSDQGLLKVHTKERNELATRREADVITAWAICATSTSNTIAIVRDGQLLGLGLAQPSRVLACKVAVLQARESGHGEKLQGAVAASDSFFPFEDGPEFLARAGIATIVATSGSVRDDAVAKVLKQHHVTLIWRPDAKARAFFGH